MSGLYLDELPAHARQKWAAARVWAAHQVPYLAHALLTLDPVVITDAEDTEQGAALRRFPADTGWHIHLSAGEIERQSVAEIGFWIVHQVTHLLREHAARFPGGAEPTPRDHDEAGVTLLVGRTAQQRRWNVATDAEINDDLTMNGLRLPEDAATPSALGLPDSGMAEQYWDALADRGDTLSTRGGVVPASMGQGDCGSACDGQPRVWDCDWPGLSRTSAQLTALDTARRIRERQRTRDDVPGGWRRWADQILEPTVDWRRQLSAQIRRGIAQTAGRVDFTYRKPSRRAASAPGIIMPSLHQPLPVVAMVIDTSGSMSDAMLGQSLAEVGGVLRAIGIGRHQLQVISADAQAYRAQRLHNITDLRLGGGGGSDIRSGIAAALALKPVPDLIVALTDGNTRWPETPPPRTRVVVGLLDPAGESPQWAETVLIG